MSDDHSRAINQKTDWVFHSKQWEASKLSQPDYCEQVGINYATFVYWRGKLKQSSQPKSKQHQFIPVKVIANKNMATNPPQSIQIKLASGHVVYLPTTLGIQEIAALLNALGEAHA